ncbi:MAG: hypothetical protein ABT00_22940, partial [Bordetella sp. SCN 68-11]
YYYDSVRASLLSRTSTAKYLNRYMSATYDEFYYFSNQLVQEFADRDRIEMQVIDVYGRIMFSSAGLSAGFVPGTSDISRCIDTKETTVFTGFDGLTGERVMSVAAPVIYQNGRVIGVVRYVSSLRLLDKQLGYIYLGLAVGGTLLMGLVVVSNRFFLRSIVNPVLRINEFAQTIAGGHYGARLDVEFNDEIGELCTTLNNMSTELARMDKLKNDFISSVSHELRTPLTAIGGWAETVANDIGDPEVATAGLAIIQKETRRLSQMVEELLDFSRLENGRLKLQPERFDLRGELYDAVFTYTELLKQEGMEVNYDEPEQPIFVYGDRNRIKQVFLNILDNAAKYGAEGKRVVVGAAAQGDFATATIRDFGIGIPSEELPFVKEKFFKGSARGRGAGIGLAVCNEIIGMHGGTLDIDSVYGEGTVITITLPLAGETEQNG